MLSKRHNTQLSGLLTHAMTWALLPVAVFATQPTMACRCASGRVMLFCPRLASRDIEEMRSKADSAASAACCVVERLPPRSVGGRPCVKCSGREGGVCAGSSATECHCTPLLRALVASAKRVGKPTVGAAKPLCRIDSAVESFVSRCPAANSHAGNVAPLDLVILHRSLRI